MATRTLSRRALRGRHDTEPDEPQREDEGKEVALNHPRSGLSMRLEVESMAVLEAAADHRGP